MPMKYKKEIIAVLDPMCSWCWGFEPVLKQLISNLPEDTRLSLLLGGLRNQGEQVWDEAFRSYLMMHWQSVHERTGQPINLDLLNKEMFEYDTEPACRAVATVRELDQTRQFSFLQALQKAFYQDARDITSTDTLFSVAKEEGFDPESFLSLFLSEKMKEKTKDDAYKARSMGANVFPSLVFIDEEGHLCVVKGYKSFEQIEKLIGSGM